MEMFYIRRYWCFLCIYLVFTIQQCMVSAFSLVRPTTRFDRAWSLRSTSQPITYTSVHIPNFQSELLIPSNQVTVVDQARSLSSSTDDKSISNQVKSWIEKGLAFWANNEGILALKSKEKDISLKEKSSVQEDSMNGWHTDDAYVNYGNESHPAYIEMSKYRELVRNGVISRKVRNQAAEPAALQSLIEANFATTNITELLRRERVRHRTDSIARRMKTDFPIASKEWTRWTNVTSRNNNDSVSLTQVISTYFAEQSVGDLGDEDSQYVPKAGYMGTLAPGEKFDEQFPIDKLPKRVLHPWPALQEVPFHVRWPPSHPMIPSPLLWIALNNMYTEEFTASELAKPNTDGGRLQPSAEGDTSTITTAQSSHSSASSSTHSHSKSEAKKGADVTMAQKGLASQEGGRAEEGYATIAELLMGYDSTGAERVVGGSLMEPRDAIRIARSAVFGPCYDPSEQISHGGSIFDYGEEIPFYHPDHGPTATEPPPELPADIQKLLQKWPDPFSDFEEITQISDLEDSELRDAQKEEEMRKKAVLRLQKGRKTRSDREMSEEKDAVILQEEIERRLFAHKENRAKERVERLEDEKRVRASATAEAASLARHAQLTHVSVGQGTDSENVQGVVGAEGKGVRGALLVGDVETTPQRDSGGSGSDSSTSKTSSDSSDPDSTNSSCEALSADSAEGLVLTWDVNMNTMSTAPESASELVELDSDLREKFRKEILHEKLISELQAGTHKPRGKRALLAYTLESSADMIEQIRLSEQSASIAPRRPGRRRTKSKSIEDPIIGEDGGSGSLVAAEVLGAEDSADGNGLDSTDEGVPF